MKIACPHCNKSLIVDLADVEDIQPCPTCSGLITLPANVSRTASPWPYIIVLGVILIGIFSFGWINRGLDDQPIPSHNEIARSDIKKLETSLEVANVVYLGEKVMMLEETPKYLNMLSAKLIGSTSDAAYHRSLFRFNKMKVRFEASSEKARIAYLRLKEEEPNNAVLIDIRNEGRVSGGVSPYDE